MAWVRAVADVKHAVPGLTEALEELLKNPHAVERCDFVDAVDAADDERIYTQVKVSMLDVYNGMVAAHGLAEKSSTMGLIYDTMHYALKKPDAWLVMKLDWLMNKVKPMNKGDDIKALFGEWHNVVMEIQHSASTGDDCVHDSLEVLMSRFGPQYNRAVRESKYTYNGELDRLIVAVHQQVEVLAEQYPVEKPKKGKDTKEKKDWKDKKWQDKKKSGDAESKSTKEEAKRPSKESMQCYEFALTGKCSKGARCQFKHDKEHSRKVMLALQEKMVAAQVVQEDEGDEGEQWIGYCGVESDPDPNPDPKPDPKSSLDPNPSLSILTVRTEGAKREGALLNSDDNDWCSVLRGKQRVLRSLDPNRPLSDPE